MTRPVKTPGAVRHIEQWRERRRVVNRRLHCANCRTTIDPDPWSDLPLSARQCWDCGPEQQRLRYIEVA